MENSALVVGISFKLVVPVQVSSISLFADYILEKIQKLKQNISFSSNNLEVSPISKNSIAIVPIVFIIYFIFLIITDNGVQSKTFIQEFNCKQKSETKRWL